MLRRPAGKARKGRKHQDIPSFRNVAGRDASALKMLSYFCANPKEGYAVHTISSASRVTPFLSITLRGLSIFAVVYIILFCLVGKLAFCDIKYFCCPGHVALSVFQGLDNHLFFQAGH